MIPESLASLPSLSSYGAALAARTDHAVADDPNTSHSQVVPLVVNTNWSEPYVVGGTSLWWSPLAHPHSVTPLGTACNVAIEL